MHKRMQELALKYYGTRDLSKLQPYQLDKITTWVTKRSPDAGKNKSRKAEQALRANKKFTKTKHTIKIN